MDSTGTVPLSRTRRVVKEAGIGLVLRFGAMAATFVATPLMLQLLGAQQLGVWLVLLSVFQWVTLFDLGVSAGARNEIARAAATHDTIRVRQAITTGWWYVLLISFTLFVLVALVLILRPTKQWLTQRVFGGIDTEAALWVVVAGACISFAAGYIQSVFAALEKASAFSLFSLASNVSFLGLLLLAQWLELQRIEEIALLYLLSIVGSNIWLIVKFIRDYPQFRPQRHELDHTLRPAILNFGVRLFIIQLSALVIFTTSRLMTSMLLGPDSVVVYDAGFKLFSIITMVHTLIMTTLWSSFTQAYARNEKDWIQRSLLRLTILMLPLALGCAVLALLAPWLIERWLGPDQIGKPLLYGMFAAVTILSCWSNIFAYFLNGIGNTSVQLYSAILAGAANIPATYYFTVTAGWGIYGILMGSLVSLSFFSILGPIQTINLLKTKK